MTAKQWREANPGEKGNIRDHANSAQLVCLVNLENLNALFIKEDLGQVERLQRLNKIAIEQMEILITKSENLRDAEGYREYFISNLLITQIYTDCNLKFQI